MTVSDHFLTVAQVHVFGKKSSVTDFAFLTPYTVSLPEGLKKDAEDWLQLHVNAGNTQTIVVARSGGDYWLLRAANEAGTDASGRLLSYLSFGAIPHHLIPQHVTDIIVGAYVAKKPDKNDGAAVTIPFNTQSTAAVPREERCATLGILTGDCIVPRVGNPATARAVISCLGMEALNFVLLAENVPTNLPEGPGLVLTTADWHPPFQTSALAEELDDLSPFDCTGLLKLAVAPSRRRALLLAASGKEPQPECADLSLEELSWLLSSPSGRAWALREAAAEQLSLLLAAGLLARADLVQLRGRLSQDDSARVAQLLRPTLDDLHLFLTLFGKGAAGVEQLLPPEAAQLWQQIRTSEPPGDLAVLTPEEVSPLIDSGLLEGLSLLDMAPLIATPLGSSLNPYWRNTLHREGLNEEILDLLLDGVPPAGPSTLPELAPSTSWVRGLSYSRLEEAGEWMCRQDGWRDWWVRAISCHPEDPDGEGWQTKTKSYTRKWLWWFREAVAAGELTREEGLRLIKQWHLSPRPPSPQILGRMWSVLGLERAHQVAVEVLHGAPTSTAPPEEAVSILALLFQEGFFDLDDLVKAVQRGNSPRLLESAGLGPLAALIDCGASPPRRPPAVWDERISPILAAACGRAEFWRRWSEGVPEEMLEWLAPKIAAEANATLVEAVMLSAKERLLTLEELQIVAGGLDPERIYRQVALRATSRGPAQEREAAIELLLCAPVVSEEKARWLKSELLGWQRQGDIPSFRVAELRSLFPVLHPVRDVLRVVLSREEVEQEEDALLPLLLEALPGTSRVPVPLPSPEMARRRPEWIAAVATLPGWEHWKELVTAPRVAAAPPS